MRRLAALLLLMVLATAPAYAQVELAYDDGTAESGVVWERPRNGAAVKFTAPGCALTGAKFFTRYAGAYWYPVGYCVLDANGPDGAPGDTLLGYSQVSLEGQGTYQEVTFASPVSLPRDDFYVVYLQTSWHTFDSNVYGLDTSSPLAGRSWFYQDGIWAPCSPAQGNVMIRALVLQPTPTLERTWGEIKDSCR